jgi:hypothetical protein
MPETLDEESRDAPYREPLSKVATLYEESMLMQPGASYSFSCPIKLPDELDDGVYGLVFVIPDCVEQYITIYVGTEPL